MAVPPQKMRELVFQMLYSRDMADCDDKDLVALMMSELAVTRKVAQEGLSKVQRLDSELKGIDALIEQTAQGYDFDRIPHVEKNILRLATYEMLHERELPAKVAIAEAMRLTKKFATPQAVAFINAILDGIYKGLEGEKVDPLALDVTIAPMDAEEQAPPEAEQ